ncbi:unnamed protein product [Cuscuta campestris]|uniref:EF-hand domain-containing protein n=1 Tax=Cuscuta campestris TaxID=132261 RepID=A0A484NR26_9ASTE|nr:unnamed protein product [Cuscuta campestris]
MVVVHHRLTAVEIAECKEAFGLCDRDGSGKVNAKELGIVMRSLGQSLTEAELEEMIKEADTNRSGTIDFNEFLGLMGSKKLSREEEDELRDAFRVFDKDNNGHITTDELRHVGVDTVRLSQKLSDAEVEEMMKEADVDDNGVIDYHEFVNVIMSRGRLRSSESRGRSEREMRKGKRQCKSKKYCLPEYCKTL